MFKELPHEYVSPSSLKDVVETGDTRKVYATVVDKADHLVRKDGRGYSDEDYAANPQEYVAKFPEMVRKY